MKKYIPNGALQSAPHFPTLEVLAANAYMFLFPDWEEHRYETRWNWIKENMYNYALIANGIAPMYFNGKYKHALTYVEKAGNPIQFSLALKRGRIESMEARAKYFGVITGFNRW